MTYKLNSKKVTVQYSVEETYKLFISKYYLQLTVFQRPFYNRLHKKINDQVRHFVNNRFQFYMND